MTSAEQYNLAKRYIVDDLPGASQIGARLNGILLKIEAGEPVSKLSQAFLVTSKLEALHTFVNDEIEWVAFQKKAELEQAKRIQQAEERAAAIADTLAAQAAQRAVELKEFFATRESDPKLRRQQEAKELRNRFGIGYIDSDYYPRVMSLLHRVAMGHRLLAKEIVWLQTEAQDCWTDELQKAWHAIEAEALSSAWQNSGDPWDAINASSHWRKAAKPNLALSQTDAALAKGGTAPKAQSALVTTRGGALRDLHRLDEAKAMGLAAHRLTPNDFRPCTLLGAVHIELGDLMSGHSWYVKAEKLGADRRAVDQDLRALLARTPKPEQQRIREFLVAQDPERFAWLRRK